MGNALGPNKTKIAKRVIEVFEFLDQNSRGARVADIARRYGRPQSSTSELLASLVEMGLLYRDLRTRIYSPTPRLASLGTFNQPEFIREGQLFAFMDRLARATRKNVMLFGMVGMHVQIFRLSPGKQDAIYDISCGASAQLAASAAGLLLLSTLPGEQAGRILRRLNAELPEHAKFNQTRMRDQVSLYNHQGHAVGSAGFLPGLRIAATLLPYAEKDHPLAMGMFLPPDSADSSESSIDTKNIIARMNVGIANSVTKREIYVQPENVPFRMVG